MIATRIALSLGVGAALLWLPAAVVAQDKPAAAPPKIIVPAAPPKSGPRTLGGRAPVGKVMSREELRSCLKRLDDVNDVTRDLDARRVVLDKEKEDLTRSGEALKAERADVEAKLVAVREWEGRVRAHGAEIEAFNKRQKDAEAAPANQREALVKELESERERLGKARAPLAEEEARVVPAYQSAVKGFNEKAQARDGVVAGWNDRNRALNDSAIKHDDERSAWLSECANRPYREDDEIAIKKGK